MGKYMRKAKMTGDVAVMDVSQSSLGVRTRAKTLALQRADGEAPPLANSESCYLELRSRRLQKPLQQLQNSRKVRRSCGCKGKEHLGARVDGECCGSALISCSIEADGLEVEASFGENKLDAESRERSTRESTLCSSIRVKDTNTNTYPGYVTKQTCSSGASQRPLSTLFINVPTPLELEEFFACEEQSLQRFFTEKYNFDFVNDFPLPGRYEWVKVSP